MTSQLQFYQVGNTSSRKITEVKQLGLRLALGWATIQELDMDAAVTGTVKSQKRRNGASITCFWGPKTIFFKHDILVTYKGTEVGVCPKLGFARAIQLLIYNCKSLVFRVFIILHVKEHLLGKRQNTKELCYCKNPGLLGSPCNAWPHSHF